jgi:hypothetical protein
VSTKLIFEIWNEGTFEDGLIGIVKVDVTHHARFNTGQKSWHAIDTGGSLQCTIVPKGDDIGSVRKSEVDAAAIAEGEP